MKRPPWHWWLQLRDLAPVLISILVLVAFGYVVVHVGALVIVAVMSHIRDAWNKPSG